MKDITEFIKESREVRRSHLDLNEPCLERGGNSTNHKGVLAQYLDTSIPSGRILLCHACHNGACSNPKHLYWGTDKENILIDSKENGTWKSPWDRAVEKYGYAEACKIQSRNKEGNEYGKGNKDKPKSKEHKEKISKSIKKRLEENPDIKSNGGRKHKVPPAELIELVKNYGFAEAASKLNEPYINVRSRYYNAVKTLQKKQN